MPHWVWWISMIAVVPSLRCEISSERITSSVTIPPALRIRCASPWLRPSSANRSIRASMQQTIATLVVGRAVRRAAISVSNPVA